MEKGKAPGPFEIYTREISRISGMSIRPFDPSGTLDVLRELSGAHTVAFNEVSGEQDATITRALAGPKEILSKAAEELGFPLTGARYAIDPQIRDIFSQQGMVEYSSLETLAGSQLPDWMCKKISSVFRIGKTFVIGMKSGERMLATIVLIFKSGKEPENRELVELLLKYIEILLQRDFAAESSILTLFSENANTPEHTGHLLQALFRAADKLPDLIYQLDGKGRILFINEAVQKYGYLREDLLGTNIIDLVHPDDREYAFWHLRERRRGVRSTRDFEVRILNSSRDTAYLQVHDRAVPPSTSMVIQAEGLYRNGAVENGFYGTIGIGHDITNEKVLNAELDCQSEIFRSMAQNVEDAVWVEQIDPHKVLYINPASERMYQLFQSEAVQDPLAWTQAIYPDDRTAVQEHINGLAEIRKERSIEYRIFDEDGDIRWIYSRMYPIRQKDGRVDKLVGIATDITERKKKTIELEREINSEREYVREINHRVKNNLVMIDSMLNLELESLPPGEETASAVLQKVKGRIDAVSLVHEMLLGVSREGMVEAAGYLRALVDKLCAVAGCANTKVRMNCELQSNIRLPVRAVIPLGMILNELVTNVLKYAFDAGSEGVITIIFRSLGPHRYELRVSDNGMKMPDAAVSREGEHIGIDLVHGLSQQIDGRLQFFEKDDEKTFSVIFNLKNS